MVRHRRVGRAECLGVPGDRGQERASLQRPHAHLALGPDGRGAGHVAQQRDLAEAGTKPATATVRRRSSRSSRLPVSGAATIAGTSRAAVIKPTAVAPERKKA